MQRDDQVQNPTHYDVWQDLAVIEIMARTSTINEFNGFCRNTALKYRLRAGKKGTGCTHQDLAKADQYQKLFDDYKNLCRDFVPANVMRDDTPGEELVKAVQEMTNDTN